jgi:hypothetical protein
MRIGSASALVLAAFALAACEGTPTTGSSASNASLDLCGLACPDGTPGGGINDADGDGIDDGADGDDSSTDGGNTTDLSPTTADVTIALESSRFVRPTSGTSLSLLTAGTSPATTTAQILSGTKPTELTIQIDTNSSSNGTWPTPIQMSLYDYGTNFPDPHNVGVNENGGTNIGGNAGYREYRAFSSEVGQERDESLQVWAWTDSYATQYRNTPNGGEATQQAWSFGGNRTALADMPIGGSANYTGRFVATAKIENYLMDDDAVIDPNVLWRVQGASTLDADFGLATVDGLLTPETWESVQGSVIYTKRVGITPTPGYTASEAPNYSWYDSTVALNGTITGNTYAGEANLRGPLGAPGPFISGDQTLYGGFFGTGAAETTGVFHVTGADPDPIGGSAGINDDRRGFLTIQGAFHGQ